jgi:hypothetical protein
MNRSEKDRRLTSPLQGEFPVSPELIHPGVIFSVDFF